MGKLRIGGGLWLGLVAMACIAAAAVSAAPASAKIVRACKPASKRQATCFALVNTAATPRTERRLDAAFGIADAAPAGYGYGPSDLQSAYNLTAASANADNTPTVAIVDAYNDPSAASDLATYRAAFGLPACGSGCFAVVDQTGSSATATLPANSGSTGWATEESLDVDMVSAICPYCKIDLVEANTPNFSDLEVAEDTAAGLAQFVSNSYGAGEFSGETSLDQYWDHPGDVITVSTGDDGYASGTTYPSSSPYVVAVGGTALSPADNARGWTESAWSGAQSGCSSYESKPSWQTDTGCAGRTTADVSAVADPNTGVAIYDTYDEGGWYEVGGTSASSPIIAATYALAGTPGAGSYPASDLYADPSALYDVTGGSNGSCSVTYLCTAGVGYDGPTGLGTPDGIAAFQGTGTTPPPPPPPASPVVNTTAPSIGGTPQDGVTLKASAGKWTAPAREKLKYTYVWEACASGSCSPITGATKSTYKPASGQVGQSLEVVVTATDTAGDTGTATSTPVGPVADPAPPANTKAPAITGTDATGRTLKVNKGAWKSVDKLTYTYLWQSCNSGVCSTVSTGTSYKVQSTDAGNTIDVQVTATDSEDQSTTATSNSVGGSIAS